jgi:hypothetical protein
MMRAAIQSDRSAEMRRESVDAEIGVESLAKIVAA